MNAKTLTPKAIELAVEHCGVLVLAGEERAAALLEVELKERFIEATALGLCPDPVGAAKALARLKDIPFERDLTKPCPCNKHRLDAILGRPRAPVEIPVST